jgi:hypothetical protein
MVWFAHVPQPQISGYIRQNRAEDHGCNEQAMNGDLACRLGVGVLVKAASRPPTARRPEKEEALHASLDETTRRLDALDAQIASDFPTYAELSNPKPLSAEAAEALLGSDEALLVYLTTDEATCSGCCDVTISPITASSLGQRRLRTR